MDTGDLIGVWTLVSFENRRSKSRSRYPFGRHPTGYLIFTADGWMLVAVMPERRGQPLAPREESGDPMHVRTWFSWQQLRQLVRYVRAATHYISYGGRYTVDGDRVVVRVAVSQMPGLVGTIQERTFAREDNRLVLTTETAWAHLRVIWERASATLGGATLDYPPV